jgi:hypothetical protein
MKKLIFLFIVPVFMQAQKPAEKKDTTDGNKSEKIISSENPIESTRNLLESYRKRAMSGENFGVLARKYSEDPGSAKNGGRYGNVKKGTMVPEFEEVVFKLKPGEISEVFETKYGFHFLQLLAVRGEYYDVRHILLSFPK